MYFKLKCKIGTLLAATMVTSMLAGLPLMAVPAGAQEATVQFTFADVTDVQASLPGEAKILVSVNGSYENVNTIQAAMTFKGDLKYKSIDYLIGQTNLPNEYQTATEPSAANSSKSVTAAVISLETPLAVEGETPLFILTFEGTAKKSVTVQLNKDDSWLKDGTAKVYAEDEPSQKITATQTGSEATQAVVVVKMDTIVDFTPTFDEPVTIQITNERTGKSISDILTADNRTALIPVTFTVENTVLLGDKYTVEISGNGYKTYKSNGIEFADGYKLTVTNSEFVPGDINKDDAVDATDKALYENIIANKEYNAAADFNRDGYVDSKDNVFNNIEESVAAPAKMAKPLVTGASAALNVSWSKPADNGSAITGYIVKYGLTASALNSQKTIAGADILNTSITGLNAGTTYHVAVAAVNAVGTGAYSDTVSAATTSVITPPGEGSGGGGGGGGGGGDTSVGGTAGITTPVAPGETFTDLGNHLWAKDAIYALKNKGIISGVSVTEFAPASNIKRGDFILILTRMLGTNNAFTHNFADVPQSSYYYNAIGSAKAAGIATGDGVNFMPENSITRQDLITLAYRAFLNFGYIQQADGVTSLNIFADKASISDYAKSAMASMVKAGIIQGSNGNVNPLGSATRAEVAVMCERLLNLIN